MRSKRIGIFWCVLSAAVFTATIASVRTSAQQPLTRRNLRKQGSPMAIAHATFERAARVMESALPIYDGHRHRAIELAKHAAKQIKEAAEGAPGGTLGTNIKRKTPSQVAARIPKGANIELSKFSAQQITASNARMQEGLQLLQQGLQQIQAIGNDPGNHMNDATEFGNFAIEAANKGLAFVAGKI